MSIQKRRESGALTIIQIIEGDPQLREYFEAKSDSQHFAALAISLLRQAIKSRQIGRAQKPKDKHYHVAYIKHNRFLSPTQKQEVADKITNIIPVNEKPVKIFAKPKPKEEDAGKYDHCIDEPKGGEGGKEESKCITKVQTSPKQANVGRDDESEKYLSPKIDRKAGDNTKMAKQKAKDYTSPSHKPTQDYCSPRQRQQNPQNKLAIDSNCKPTIKESNKTDVMVSPRAKENYDKVESRIKFLIERDKQNKKVERLLERQNKKIEKLQERQEKLLLLQYEQQRQLSRSNKIRQYMKEQLSDSSDSQSIEQDKPYQKLSAISRQLDSINGRADSVRSSHAQLHSNLQSLKDKTYKLNSQPIYALSSSSSSDSQN